MTYDEKVDLVKSVTKAHPMDVKKALSENNNNVNDAIVWLDSKMKSTL
jgi:translation elongation factor EF-Ts